MSASLYGPTFFEGRSPLVEQSAAVVVPVLTHLLEPWTVLDVGCGQGEWTAAFERELRGPETYTPGDVYGVDIAAPLGRWFRGWDLTRPLHLERFFDLVLCVEVGEHLPEASADTLVDTIVRHAGDIVFGAAVPGQEGVGHINCQPHEYWHAKFAERGYEMRDAIRPLIANDHRVSPWYRNNMFLYLEPS
jgi:SAM-dependent methyltransferase